MKKGFKSLVVASLLLVGSSAMAGIDNMSINVGGANTTVGSASSSTGLAIGFEWSFLGNAKAREDDSYDVFFDVAYNSVKNGYVTKIGIGARYEVAPKIWLGGSFGASGFGLDNANNFNTTTYSGLMYGVHGKYELTQNHGVLLEYRNASMTDPTGLISVDVSSLSALYSYSF